MNFLEQIYRFIEPYLIYFEVFGTFFAIGAFTFGGGYAMLPLIQERVLAQWGDVITEDMLVSFIGISESTPGPFAVNMATYIGKEMGGVFGSVCATLGVVLPSFIVILIVARCYDKFRENQVVKGCMAGLKPAVVGLIANAVVNVIMLVFFDGAFSWAAFTDWNFYLYAAIFAAMLVLAFRKVSPIIIICISAVLGIVIGYLT